MLAALKALITVEGVETAKAGLASVEHGFDKTAAAASGRFNSAISTAVESIRSLSAIAAGASLAVAGLSTAVGFNQAVAMDSMIRGLATVSENVQDLMGQLERLREVAKLPGLGFREAVEGSLILQSAGLSAREAEAALRGFGNALASVGRGKDDLQQVVAQFQQMVSQNKVTMEDLRVVLARAPSVSKAMQAAFGTTNPEALAKMGVGPRELINGLSVELAKLPQLLNSPLNSIENLKMGLLDALQPIGDGIIAAFTSIGGPIDAALAKVKAFSTAVGEVIAAVGKSGVLADALGNLFGASSSGGLREGFIKTAATVVTFIGNIRGQFETLAYNIGQGWDFITSLFDNLAQKAQITFSLIVEGATAMGDAIAVIMKAIFAPILGEFRALGVIVPKAFEVLTAPFANDPAMQGIRDTLGGGMRAYQIAMDAVDATSPVKAPQFRAFGNLMQGYDSIAAQIRANMGPLPNTPDGLPFGGKSASENLSQQASSSVWAQWDKYLAGIERNTARTADLINSRRVSGGGELAQMGISGAELRKRTAARNGALYGRA